VEFCHWKKSNSCEGSGMNTAAAAAAAASPQCVVQQLGVLWGGDAGKCAQEEVFCSGFWKALQHQRQQQPACGKFMRCNAHMNLRQNSSSRSS
jgi:hypothetical protein